MKPPLHKNAVTREIDQLFMEPVTIEMGKHKGRISYQNIDYRNPIALRRLVEQKLMEYLKAHPDNTPALFIESQTEKYRKFQGYFPKYKSESNDNEARKDKEYYFALNRYLTEIERLGVNSFEQLFKEAAFYVEGLVSPYTGQKNYAVVKQLELETHKVKFSIYLADKYNITTDEIYTGHYFTKEYFLEYLKAEQERISKAKIEFEQEKQTWQITGQKETNTSPGAIAKFYTDNDFVALIQELGKLPVNRVKDILEHHYKQAYFPNNMARFNWLNQLRAILIKAFPVKDERPMQILLANHWVENIISKHVHDINAKANNWLSDEEIRKANHDNRTELLNRLAIVAYFEVGNIKVELFTNGNEHFKAQAKLDHADILKAENDKSNTEIKEAKRTRDLIHLRASPEAEISDLNSLLNEKFKAAQMYQGYKTITTFAKHEAEQVEIRFGIYFTWFPILKQWVEFLKDYKYTKPKSEISLPQLALMLHYMGQTVTRKNGMEIAKQHGHNSGEKLFQLYTKFNSRQNRIGKEATRKKNLNKLTLFQSVIPLLTTEAQRKATDEMNTFKATFEKET